MPETKETIYRGYAGKTGERMKVLDDYCWNSSALREASLANKNKSMRRFFMSLLRMIDVEYGRSTFIG